MRAAGRLAVLISVIGLGVTACRSSRSGSPGLSGPPGLGGPPAPAATAQVIDGPARAAPYGPSGGAHSPKDVTTTGGAVVVLNAGGRALPFRVELATSDATRERGLMYRNHMDADSGMLFVFEREAPLTFWMKNTLIPLDIIFIGSDRRIVGIVENATPETETPRRVDGVSRYVLEIGGGLSRKLGVTPGSTVEFQGIGRDVLSNAGQ
ncbi:MAG: DUF192 domain-containing protein [Deltaproteobacteria bacterium]|nr:DUF192 domain-containing protein [Deltaproteobacteria bacterium]